MNPQEIALAKRLVALEWWDWKTLGIWYTNDGGYQTVVIEAGADGTLLHIEPDGLSAWGYFKDDGWYPDLRHPATVGCLLMMVAEATKNGDGLSMHFDARAIHDEHAWWVDAEIEDEVYADHPGPALARVILRARGC